MLTSTRLLAWVMGLLLAAGLSAAASAQQLPPQVWDPASTDPQYEARKLRAAQPPRVPTESARALQRPALVERPDCFTPFDTTATGGWTQVPRGDDTSYGPIALGWDFSLYGSQYSSVYININGNITFNAPLTTFNAAGFPISTPMIAAFWADVDTRNLASGTVWFKVFPDRLVIVWNRVGYFGRQADKKNTFQLTIKANTAPGFNDNDVLIAYDDMQWTTGSASQGQNGFGGVPATVGANRGDNVSFIQTGRFNLNSSQAPNQPTVGTPGGIDWLDGQCLAYQVRGTSGSTVSNIPPAVAGMPSGNAITVAQGETRTVTLQFSGPETNQTVNVSTALNGLCNATAVPTGNGGTNPTVVLTVTGSPCNVGTNTVNFTALDNGLPAPVQVTFPLQVTVSAPAANGTWTGAVSTDWATPGNWTNNVLPTATTDVVIPSAVPRMPVLSSAGAAAALTVATGASLNVNSSGTLTLNGDLTNNGSISGAGTLLTGGSAPQTFRGSSPVSMANVTVGSSGLLLTAPLLVARMLTLNGNLAAAVGNLTLLSSATGTAMAVNNGGALVTGVVTVQRYLDPSLNAGLGYRHLSSPVAFTTVADLATGSFSPVVNPAYNTQGNTATPFPTVFGYNQDLIVGGGSGSVANFDQGWVSPASTSDNMEAGRGYTVNLAGGQTVDFVGRLSFGSVTIGGLGRGSQPEAGWHLLGNPYPAPIDWNQAFANSTGLANAVHVYRSSGQYAGFYASYVNNISNNGGTNIIPLGQAFFVRTSTPGVPGSLTLNDASRITIYNPGTLYRTATDTRPLVRLSLNGLGVSDQATVYFEAGATAGFDTNFDAPKLSAGHNVLLGLSTPTGTLAINGLAPLTGTPLTVPLLVRVARADTYTLRTDDLLNLPAGTTVQLRDLLTGTLTPLAPLSTYSFTADASLTGPRFELIFNPARITASAPTALSAQVSVYPNPARQQLYLSLPADQQPAEVVLLNALGQQVLHRQLPASRGTAAQVVPLERLARGVYTLRVALAAGTVTRRVVVE